MIRIWIVLVVTIACCGRTFAASPQSAPSKRSSLPLAKRLELARKTVVPLLGHDVKNDEGTVVGQITNILVDHAGQPQAVVIDYGGFLGIGLRKIAVSMQVLTFLPGQANGIVLTLTIDQLKGFPEYKPHAPILVATPPTDPGLGTR